VTVATPIITEADDGLPGAVATDGGLTPIALAAFGVDQDEGFGLRQLVALPVLLEYGPA
jgi:hypothetical protein